MLSLIVLLLEEAPVFSNDDGTIKCCYPKDERKTISTSSLKKFQVEYALE